ncbi:glycosyltransferase [Candidatus Woesearchaeota archaeon]|nr:glycosyltransferase [Candidatus Woesearchaeota archaeon]
MKFLVVMKRFGANKDMVMQNFGRQIRLFEPLAKKHKIDFLCPDYKKKENKDIVKNNIRYFIRPYSILQHFRFISELKRLIKKNDYDIIVGSTDPLICILSYFYAKKFKKKFVYEMQDNFEVYSSYKIPFVSFFDKTAIKGSEIVITVSDSLNKKIGKIRNKKTFTIQNGVDFKLFKEKNKILSRKKSKLPLRSKIIAYIGNLDHLRSGGILTETFNKIREKYPNACLLLSGKLDKSIDIKQEGIIFRKFSKRDEVVFGLNSADVLVLPNPLNNFTKYCFPYKLLEYMSCNVPIVATRVGDVATILDENSLCNPNDSEDMTKKILQVLKKGTRVDYRKKIKEFSWGKLSNKLDIIVKNIDNASRGFKW